MKGLLAVTVSALLAAALVVPALRPTENPDGPRSPSEIPAVGSASSGFGTVSGLQVSLSAGAPEPSSGRAVSWARATTPPGPTADSRPALGSPALLPDSGGRGPVSRDPRRAAPVRESAPQGARTGRTPSQAPKRVLGAATARSQTASHALRGLASWYCGYGSPCTRGYGPGPYAAAGPALRSLIPGWRGRSVTVAAAGVSVRVQLVDACGCPGGRVLDLYSWVFSQMAPLSAGLLEVSVSWT